MYEHKYPGCIQFDLLSFNEDNRYKSVTYAEERPV